MKVVFCQDCGDIIAPLRRRRDPRWCVCRRHATWWEDPVRGVIHVYDSTRAGQVRAGVPVGRRSPVRVFVIGMTNSWLMADGHEFTKEQIDELLDEHPGGYLFKDLRQVSVRVRPGMTPDTVMVDELP